MIQYIREQLPQEELLAQLAEEASELSQAALKLRRVLDGRNPTPVTYDEAIENLHEEIADVRLLLELLELTNKFIQTEIMAAKLVRWAKRLEEARQEDAPCTK